MKVYGYQLTDEQIEAGNKAMKKQRFLSREVSGALIAAGVPYWYPEAALPRDSERVAERAADRLIQKARKSGEIFLVKHGLWGRH